MSSSSSSNIYQVAGLDNQARGFNRQATVTYQDNRFHAVFHYERFCVVAEHQESEHQAILELIRRLHDEGYRELRSRLHFRGKDYLGNQEDWQEHAHPSAGNVWQRFFAWVRGQYPPDTSQ